MEEKEALEKLIKKGEGERLAFVASPEMASTIAQHVCAFLNGKGGTVLVGVTDRGKVKSGLHERQAVELRKYLFGQISPQALYTVSSDTISKGKVISVDVPAGGERPYVFDGTVFVRTGALTTKAVARTMKAMVEEKARETQRWERRSAVGVSIKDLNGKLIEETVRRAVDKRGYRFTDPRSRGDVLGDLSLMWYGQLTNAADALFGRRVALRQPQTRMRAVRYESDKGDDFLDEQLYEGPAFELLENAMAFLRRHVSIRSEFSPGKLTRESRPQYPFYSVREGLVNALVHRDYASFSGGVALSVYPNRVEIWNSGSLPPGVSLEDLHRDNHPSVLVNPDLSLVFYLRELMERVGRGTFKILQECRSFGMPPPEWRQETSGVRLTFHAVPRRRSTTMRLNERQTALLKYLRPGDKIRQPQYQSKYAMGVTERQARRDLNELTVAGYLIREGAGPKTAYERVGKK